MAGDWDEDLHPRDEEGKFTDGGGGATGGAKPGKVDAAALSKWVEKKSRSSSETPGKVIGEAKVGDGKRTWTMTRPEGMSKESWQDHYDKDPNKGGRPSPERQKLHDEIIHEATSKAKPVASGEKKVAIFTMGPPASGKSSAMRDTDESKFVKVDPDSIKEKIPEYKKATADRSNTFKGAAAMVHEESSHIGKQVLKKAIDEGKHVIVDGTGQNESSMISKMESLKKAGYEVHVRMPYLEYDEGKRRMDKRAEETGRYVPDDVVKDSYDTIPHNFERIVKMADGFKMIDNRTEEKRTVWSKEPGGEEKHDDPDFVREYRSKYTPERESKVKKIIEGRKTAGKLTSKVGLPLKRAVGD